MRARFVLGFQIGLVLAALFFAGRWIVRALASDETKIRRVIEEMVDGFNDQRTSRVLDGIAQEFADMTSGADRATVREALFYVFFNEIDPTSKKFALHAELDESSLAIEVRDGEPATAKASVSIAIQGLQGKPWWNARVEGELQDLEGGWAWTRTTAVNHAERSGSRRR